MASQKLIFADEYLVDLNATKAAIRAGYSEKSARSKASQLLDDPEVQAYIEKRQKRLSDKMNWTHERILQRFSEISDRCMQAEPVLDKEGNPTGEYKFDPNGAIKATENIAKHLGFYEVDNRQKSTQLVADKITFK